MSSGTWVHVTSLRLNAIDAFKPLARDVVVAGHGRDSIALLVVPDVEQCRDWAKLPTEASTKQVLEHSSVRAHVRSGMNRMQLESRGSSMHAQAALLLEEPPSADAGEITDKGYINQRAVLDRRAALVSSLFDPTDLTVIRFSGAPR